MARSFQNITGTFDILPDTSTTGDLKIPGSAAWHHVESVIRDVMARFNLEEIRTPILEETELVARGLGQLTDVVSKEMFIIDRGDDSYVLRPELTAPVMRAFLQHHLEQRGGVQKLFYIGPCFRAERPQKGRYRQFHQFGCEIIGADDARADAETIALMLAVYDALGVTKMDLRINTLGDAESRPRYKDALREYFRPHEKKLSETSRARLDTNPLRILDTKDEKERELLDEAPLLIDYISDESREAFEQVKSYLDELEIVYNEDPYLVRGLDYYTHTAFELESPDLGAQSALAGGGRYDLLSAEIGGRAVPAVGFAAGMERLFLALDAQGVELPGQPGLDVFMVALGDEAAAWTFREAQSLRKMGLHVGLDLKGRSMKAQMREANRQNARYVVIVGKDELSSGVAQLKEMSTGEQDEISADEIGDRVRHTPEEAGVSRHI